MIQFNLLPDVKLEYIRTLRRKRLIVLGSVIVIIVSFLIFTILFVTVRVGQRSSLEDLDNDIKSSVKTLQSKPDLNKVLTIQNQLKSLPDLHSKKVMSSRLYDFLTQLTPNQANISQVDVDFANGKIILKGAADSVLTINKFVDTIKFTKYQQGDQQKDAFSNVVLQNFSVTGSKSSNPAEDRDTSYDIAFNFDPVIFALSKESTSVADDSFKLIVPNIISTRSETQKPASLFVPEPLGPDKERDN